MRAQEESQSSISPGSDSDYDARIAELEQQLASQSSIKPGSDSD